jgi:hypothetical protein
MKKLYYLTLLLLLFPLVSASPPIPHAVQGYVYSKTGSEVPLGTPVTISWAGNTIIVPTYGPPIHPGFYSATINAEDGDVVTVSSSYQGYFGSNSTTITTYVTRLNIVCNKRYFRRAIAAFNADYRPDEFILFKLLQIEKLKY